MTGSDEGAAAPRTDRDVPLAVLWFALLGGPVAWSAHLLASYPMVPVACRMGTTAPLHAITAMTAAIAASAAAAGWWAWQRARGAGLPDGPGRFEASESRAGFMGLAGMLLALLFTFAILMEGLPPLLQDPCQRGM
jgi:hypothetical protein